MKKSAHIARVKETLSLTFRGIEDGDEGQSGLQRHEVNALLDTRVGALEQLAEKAETFFIFLVFVLVELGFLDRWE
jgi:hypothetical protein